MLESLINMCLWLCIFKILHYFTTRNPCFQLSYSLFQIFEILSLVWSAETGLCSTLKSWWTGSHNPACLAKSLLLIIYKEVDTRNILLKRCNWFWIHHVSVNFSYVEVRTLNFSFSQINQTLLSQINTVIFGGEVLLMSSCARSD